MGARGYAKATVRHFPKHLLRKPGEPPRPAVPETVQDDLAEYDKYDLDPQACLFITLQAPPASPFALFPQMFWITYP